MNGFDRFNKILIQEKMKLMIFKLKFIFRE